MPVWAGPQVSASLFKTLGALTGAVESLWNPDAGQPLEHLVSLIQESRALVRASSVLFSQEEAAAVNAAEAGDADSSDTEADEQQLADVEDTHAPDGPRHASASPHRHSWEHASVTPPAKKTRTCEQYPDSSGDQEAVQAQRLSALAMHIPRGEDLVALTQRAGPSSRRNQALGGNSGVDVRSCVGCIRNSAWPSLARLL